MSGSNNMHNFILVNADTDSISICKQDASIFSEEEQQNLLKEINSLLPEKIKFENDGYYDCVIVLRAKNYVLYDQGKPNGKQITIKGSGLKATSKELGLKECITRFIHSLLGIIPDTLLDIYNGYVKEIHQTKDISRWTSKKTITKAVLKPTRPQEQKILNAIAGRTFSEGDKIRVYFKFDGIKEVPSKTISKKTGLPGVTKKKMYSLKLEEDWTRDHDKETLLKKLAKNIKVFEKVVDISQFPDYTLKKNKNKLQELLGEDL
jgi:DNA polymerase elongation subunit (family B)